MFNRRYKQKKKLKKWLEKSIKRLQIRRKIMTTKEQRKVKALEILQKLDIYKPYIKGFEKENEVCYFERFAGFWAWQDEELQTKIKELEEKYNCTVYAVTHEYTEFGELYDFLLVNSFINFCLYSLYFCNELLYSFSISLNFSNEKLVLSIINKFL